MPVAGTGAGNPCAAAPQPTLCPASGGTAPRAARRTARPACRDKPAGRRSTAAGRALRVLRRSRCNRNTVPPSQKWNIVRQVCIERVDVCAVKIIERRQFSEKTEADGAARLDQADRAVRTLAQRGMDACRRLVGQDEIRRYNVIRVHALLRIASPSQPSGRPRRSSPYSSGRMNTVQADGTHGRKLCASASISRAQRSPSFVAQSAAARASV